MPSSADWDPGLLASSPVSMSEGLIAALPPAGWILTRPGSCAPHVGKLNHTDNSFLKVAHAHARAHKSLSAVGMRRRRAEDATRVTGVAQKSMSNLLLGDLMTV